MNSLRSLLRVDFSEPGFSSPFDSTPRVREIANPRRLELRRPLLGIASLFSPASEFTSEFSQLFSGRRTIKYRPISAPQVGRTLTLACVGACRRYRGFDVGVDKVRSLGIAIGTRGAVVRFSHFAAFRLSISSAETWLI